MSTAADSLPTYARPDAPKVLGGLTPYLTVDGATKASELYQKAFGATVATSHPVDEKGRTMHIHLHINGSSLMLSDAYPEHGCGLEKPQAFNLTLQVDDIDKWFDRAVAAGVTVVMPVEKMFWGSRYCQLRDRFNVMWAINELPG